MSVVNEARKKKNGNESGGMIRSEATRVGDWIIAVISFIILFVCLLPMLNVLARSLSDANALMRNEVFLWPKGWNLVAYQTILGNAKYLHSLWYTAALTVGCTLLSLFMTICCAYPLTYDQLRGGKVINVLILFTMYFSAGTIPHYLLMKNLAMLDTVWCLVVPSCISVYNMIVMRSFFYGIPESLREAAEIDGAGPIRTLLRIYLPLSLPVIATLALFYAVGRWNGFSDALLYIKKEELFPIQLYLYYVLQNSTQQEIATQEGFATPGVGETVKMATVMFATVPILLVYWNQKAMMTIL